jgi:hypothetical protein
MATDAPFNMWYTYAMLDYGDHALGAARRDPEHVGVIELTDQIKWVPNVGEEWVSPISATTVRTPRGFLGLLFDGLELEVFQVGIVRFRATPYEPGVAVPPANRTMGDARATGKLRKQLIKRGAPEASA